MVTLAACPSDPPTDTETGGTSSTSSGTTTGDATSTGTTSPESTSTGAAAVCGDGVVEGDEACDDGNQSDLDGCSNACALAVCGDGFVRPGYEECDDGNASNDDACVSGCKGAVCGDGYVQVGVEGCDDGNAQGGDQCSNECTPHAPGCGDGFVQAGEECDDGDVDDTDNCTSECKKNVCGDGHPHAVFEECDDGNGSNEDACLSSCLANTCGDGFANAGVEACDDGNAADDDACPTTCEAAACGDGFVYAGVEACDAGAANQDGLYGGCQKDCSLGPHCGDGVVQMNAGEGCDDGNQIDGDGCSATCVKELPPECQNPVLLSEADRAASFNDGPGGVQKCDKTGDKWHRFTGAAGTKMPTSPPSVWSCGTDAPGWMKGEYPGVDDGIVDLSVCFAWIGNACEWSADIQLRNCGDFYVFRLPDPPETCLRYCGDA